MLNKLKGFIESKYFLIILSIVTFLSWLFNFDSIGPQPKFDMLEIFMISIYALIIAFILIFFKETIYTFPLIIQAIIMLSNQNMGMDSLNNLFFIYVILAILIISFIYHLFKYKVKLNLGTLGVGLLIFAVAYVLSLSGYFLDQKPFEISIIVISLMGFGYFGFYVFYRSTNKENHLPYLLKSLYYLSFVVILQTVTMFIIYFIDNKAQGSFLDTIKVAIDQRWMYEKNGIIVRLSVGWGVGNNIAGLLAMLLPVNMYFLFISKFKKDKILHLATMVLSLIIIVLTTSRGAYLGVLAFMIIFLLAIILYAKIDYKKYKKELIIGGIILVIIAVPLGIYMFDFFKSFMSSNSILNGREEDWSDAIKYFLEYPVFGKSWYSDMWEDNSFRSYHNTILHTLATMGMFGLFALIYHHIGVIHLFIKNKGFETLVVSGMLIITHVHGMVDNTYYAPLHLLPLLILFIAIENKKTS